MSGREIVLSANLFQHEFGDSWREIVLDALRSDHPASHYSSLELIARAIESQTQPEEPSGLGAVAEDGAGVLWIRTADDPADFNWTSTEGWANWSDIKVTRVLSEGIRP